MGFRRGSALLTTSAKATILMRAARGLLGLELLDAVGAAIDRGENEMVDRLAAGERLIDRRGVLEVDMKAGDARTDRAGNLSRAFPAPARDRDFGAESVRRLSDGKAEAGGSPDDDNMIPSLRHSVSSFCRKPVRLGARTTHSPGTTSRPWLITSTQPRSDLMRLSVGNDRSLRVSRWSASSSRRGGNPRYACVTRPRTPAMSPPLAGLWSYRR